MSIGGWVGGGIWRFFDIVLVGSWGSEVIIWFRIIWGIIRCLNTQNHTSKPQNSSKSWLFKPNSNFKHLIPFFNIKFFNSRAEYGAYKCFQAGGTYMFTQLCKMLILTFFPETINSDPTGFNFIGVSRCCFRFHWLDSCEFFGALPLACTPLHYFQGLWYTTTTFHGWETRQ